MKMKKYPNGILANVGMWNTLGGGKTTSEVTGVKWRGGD